MARKKRVVLSLLGTTLDTGRGAARWERWRPTVALGMHEDFALDRLELLVDPRFASLAATVKGDLGHVSPDSEVALHDLPLADPWDFEEVYEALFAFARRYRFDPEREEYFVHITTGTHVAQICLFLLTESRDLPGKLLQTSPPRAGKDGPGHYAIIDLDLSRYDRIASRFQKERAAGQSLLKAGIATRSPRFNALIEEIEKVASVTRAPILLTGETGAGKSQLARKIHELKQKRQEVKGELADVNCATLRGDMAASTLFGHVKGAFTGAQADRPGLLRKAHGGVLFLDEIGELGLDEQAMLLRAIEDKVFYPVGSDREVKVDFQLLAGTNRDLRERVREGRFREDLLARIDTWTFRLPGLRERPEDLEPNLDFELERASRRLGTHVTMSREAREAFLAFGMSHDARWSANFRDLDAAVTRMATLAEGGRITRDGARKEMERLLAGWSEPSSGPPGRSVQNARDGAGDAALEAILARVEPIDPFDRAQLAFVLRTCRSARSLSDAGRSLFAVSRERKASSNDADRLRKYLARFGLAWGDLARADP